MDKNAPGSKLGILFDIRKHKRSVQLVVCCFLAFHSAFAFVRIFTDPSMNG